MGHFPSSFRFMAEPSWSATRHWAISAPIRDIDRNVIAAMSIPFPTNRLDPERIPEIAQALMEAANDVSANE